MLPKSAITFLKTRNMEETTRFYRELLAFQLVLDQGRCRIFQICPNSYVGFCLTDSATGSDEIILTLEVEDVDGFCSILEEKGVSIEIQPRFNPDFNIYQMFIRDPNGYRIEIQRFLDPIWSQHKTKI